MIQLNFYAIHHLCFPIQFWPVVHCTVLIEIHGIMICRIVSVCERPFISLIECFEALHFPNLGFMFTSIFLFLLNFIAFFLFRLLMRLNIRYKCMRSVTTHGLLFRLIISSCSNPNSQLSRTCTLHSIGCVTSFVCLCLALFNLQLRVQIVWHRFISFTENITDKVDPNYPATMSLIDSVYSKHLN